MEVVRVALVGQRVLRDALGDVGRQLLLVGLADRFALAVEEVLAVDAVLLAVRSVQLSSLDCQHKSADQ